MFGGLITWRSTWLVHFHVSVFAVDRFYASASIRQKRCCKSQNSLDGKIVQSTKAALNEDLRLSSARDPTYVLTRCGFLHVIHRATSFKITYIQ